MKISIFTLIVLTIFLTVFLKLKSFSFNSFASDNSELSNSISLGAIAPLTGDFAIYGKYIADGLELAKEQLQSEKILVDIYLEDACLPLEAQVAVRNLVNFKHIQALTASYCVVGLGGIDSLIKRDKIITRQTSVVPQGMLDSNSYVSTSFPRISEETELLAEKARRLSGKTVGILYLDTPWGVAYSDLFEKSFSDLGGEIIFKAGSAIGDNDFRGALTKVKAKKPDILFYVHVGDSLLTLIKQSKQLGLNQNILLTHDGDTPEVLNYVKKFGSKVNLFTPSPFKSIEVEEDFINSFKSKFSYRPSVQSIYAYFDALQLGRGISLCQDDLKCLRKELAQEVRKTIFKEVVF